MQRGRVHGTVLAHLQLGQVEAERLDLPDQVLKLAVRLANGTRLGQRPLGQAQVVSELPGGSERQAASAGGILGAAPAVRSRVARSRSAAYSR